GSPPAVEGDELVERVVGEVRGGGVAQRLHRDPYLGDVFGAVGAVGQMGFEAGAIAGVERAVEICRHHADSLATHDGAPTTQPRSNHSTDSFSGAIRVRSSARPRWSNTRWLPSLMPRSAETSSADNPSTSR